MLIRVSNILFTLSKLTGKTVTCRNGNTFCSQYGPAAWAFRLMFQPKFPLFCQTFVYHFCSQQFFLNAFNLLGRIENYRNIAVLRCK